MSKVYHATRNQFERFRVFLELISRFEFDFRRCGNFFFERFDFLVCSKFDHTQCGRTCVCAVARLHPHNSISNVVVSVTIYDDMYILNYMYVCLYMYMYMCFVCMYICVYVCVCSFVVCCVVACSCVLLCVMVNEV